VNRVAAAEKDTMRSVFEKFDTERPVWAAAVSCAAVLDALLALALVSSTPGYVWPDIVAREGTAIKPFIHITKGRHPMLEHSLVER
jgi:DNA mismatch repair ATPase MutS